MKFDFSTHKHLITLLLLFSFFGCTTNPLEIDVSGIEIDLKVQHFEQDLIASEYDFTEDQINQLAKDYGLFFQDFTTKIIGIGDIKSAEAQFHLNQFKKDPYITDIKAISDNTFGDFSKYQDQLKQAFKHYKHYFPNKDLPTIITYISGYNYAIVTDETYLGIGLDMFLGAKHEDYPKLGLPQYKSDFMAPEYLVPGAMLGWIATEFELEESNADLLTEMVHQGKVMYILDAMMPTSKEGLKISYTDQQVNWCYANQEQVWFYFIDNELLYTKKTSDIIKFMGEAPFVQGFPEGAPGRIGHWVGWQIVKAYMEKFPETKLEQLMKIPAQQILSKSKYKP